MADLPKQFCALQAFRKNSCLAANLTCVCKDPTYAAVFDKCETKTCTSAKPKGSWILFLPLVSHFCKVFADSGNEVTNAHSISLCAQLGRYRHINSTASSTAARVSGTVTPIGNGTMIHNSTTMHKGTFIGTPAPFTGGAGVVKGCGVVVLTGLWVGGMVVAL